jgi:hypothetical protein
MTALILALGAALFQAQASRPVTVVSEVRGAIADHDLTRAEAIVSERRREKGVTPEIIEAISWLARGAQAEGQPDRAERTAVEAMRLAMTALGGRRVDDDRHLATAIGSAIEVQAQVGAARGGRSDAIAFLQRELDSQSSQFSVQAASFSTCLCRRLVLHPPLSSPLFGPRAGTVDSCKLLRQRPGRLRSIRRVLGQTRQHDAVEG